MDQEVVSLLNHLSECSKHSIVPSSLINMFLQIVVSLSLLNKYEFSKTKQQNKQTP
jgi:hypothetical protein